VAADGAEVVSFCHRLQGRHADGEGAVSRILSVVLWLWSSMKPIFVRCP
jgi:hypothetical protein